MDGAREKPPISTELPFVHDEDVQDHGYKPLGRRYPETNVGWYRRIFDDNGIEARSR